MILINLLASIWKKAVDAQKQATPISAARLPLGGQPVEALVFIITALGFIITALGMQRYLWLGLRATLCPTTSGVQLHLVALNVDVNPKKPVSFILPDSAHTVQMRGIPFPKEKEFRSPGGRGSNDGQSVLWTAPKAHKRSHVPLG